MSQTPGQRLTIGVGRLVNNLAIERGWSIERAIFALECELGELKRKPPSPPTPPVLEAKAA